MMLFSDNFSKLIMQLLTYVAIKEKFKYNLEVVSTVAIESVSQSVSQSVNCRCSENLNALYVFDDRVLFVNYVSTNKTAKNIKCNTETRFCNDC